MVALFGALLLGDSLNPLAWLAVALSAFGVIALSAPRIHHARRVDSMREMMQAVMREMMRKPTAIGLGAAAWLGASVVFFRGAALSLNHPRGIDGRGVCVVGRAMHTNRVVVKLDCPARTRRNANASRGIGDYAAQSASRAHWRQSVGSAHLRMQNDAHVRALGQIELLFAFVAATLFYKERVRRIEILGIALVAGGVMVIALA